MIEQADGHERQTAGEYREARVLPGSTTAALNTLMLKAMATAAAAPR